MSTELDDIEITPAMIEAGVTALVNFNHDYEREADAVVRIFEAMLDAVNDPPPASTEGYRFSYTR